MKVLYLCHRIPFPPDKGDKIRAFHQVRAIAARHEVDLFTLADQAEDLAYAPELERFCRQVTVRQLSPKLQRLRSLPYFITGTPLTVPYFYSAELDRRIREAVERRSYDRVVVYCSAMAQYVAHLNSIPLVVDLVDADSDKWTQYASHTRFPFSAVYRREGRRLREYEIEVCRRASAVIVTTEREAELIGREPAGAPIHVITNGVDTGYFEPSPASQDAARPTVVFIGDMSYFPNEQAAVFFAHSVLPLIRKSVVGIRFLVVGRNPTRKVQMLAKLEGVEVTGMVPDVRPFLAQAGVSVAPFSMAAGIQNKVLEAMASGLPVVATSTTVRGLTPYVAEVVETADTAEELAARITRLLGDPDVARLKGLESRSRVAADYSWARSMDRLLELVENPAISVAAGVLAAKQ